MFGGLNDDIVTTAELANEAVLVYGGEGTDTVTTGSGNDTPFTVAATRLLVAVRAMLPTSSVPLVATI